MRSAIRASILLFALALPFALQQQHSPIASAADPEDRVLAMLNAEATGGTVGLYLKEVNGAVLAANNETFQYEPASSIKALIHFHAMKQVEDGTVILGSPVTLDRLITWNQGPANYANSPGPGQTSCPDGTLPTMDRLDTILTQMMQPSDNRSTQAMRDFFGDANINTTRTALGMNNTGLNHSPIGCGAAALANPNQLTLVDAGLLYEGVANGFLNATTRQQAYSLMLSESGLINSIIDQEAVGLGLSSDSVDEFKALRQSAIKAGSYTLNSLEYRADSGWAQFTYLDSNCDEVDRSFVFGAFIHQATALAGTSIRTIATELLREQIRAALESWDACADMEVTSKVDSPDPVETGGVLAYTIKVTNKGPSSASAVVTDNLPAGLTFVSCNGGVGGFCSGAGNNRSVSFANIPDGGTGTIVLTATVDCDVANAAVVSNTATIVSGKTDSTPGNDSASATTTVNNPAPIVDATIGTSILWPPNHDLENVGLNATAVDGLCPAPVAFQVAVFGNEDDELGPPHSPDAKNIGIGSLRLRSEREGPGDGRVYLIVVKATDAANQTSFDTVTVVIPKSQSKKDKDAANALAAAAKAFADSHNGAPPAGYFVIGDGPVLGPKQ